MHRLACKLVLVEVSSPSSAFVRATSQIKANLTEHRMNPGAAEMLGTISCVNRKNGTNVQTHQGHQSLDLFFKIYTYYRRIIRGGYRTLWKSFEIKVLGNWTFRYSEAESACYNVSLFCHLGGS